MKFYDRILTNTGTATGTGDFTWTAAAAQYALPPSGVATYVVYTILDADGAAWETGRTLISESAGTYTLDRDGAQVVTASSNSGLAVTFTASSTHSMMMTPDALYIETTIPPAARVKVTPNLTGQADTTIVPWTHEIFDDADFFDSGGDTTMLVVPATGVSRVVVDAGIRIQNFASDTAFQVAILHNGTISAYYSSNNGTVSGPSATLSTGILSVGASEYFQLRIVCTEPSYDLSQDGTFMSIRAIAGYE